MTNAYEEFSALVGEINDLICAINILTWDRRTQMPPEGADPRAATCDTQPHRPGTLCSENFLARARSGRSRDRR